MRLVLVGHRRTRCTGIRLVWLEGVGQQHLAEHQHVWTLADRIGAHEPRLQDTVAVVSRSLIGRGAVEAPDARLVAVVQNFGLGPHQRDRLGPVDPNVLRTVNHARSPTSLPSSGAYVGGTVSNKPFLRR